MKYEISENELHVIPENKEEEEITKRINDADVDGIVFHHIEND